MKTLTLLFLLISGFGIRFLRWLAWFQQKEYRLDRIGLFLRSREGVKEFWRLLPKKNDFSRIGLKRPKMTPRALLTAFLSLSLLVLVIILVWACGWQIVVLTVLSLYLLLPLIILLATLPLELAKWLITLYWLNKASLLIKKHQPIVIGVTGSYGKTSSKLLLAAVLSQKYSVFATPGSFNTKLSIAQVISRQYQGEKLVIIEYAAYTTGEIATLTKFFPPQIAVITGLTEQHLGLFGSLQKIVQAKAELVRALPVDGKVFVNALDGGADQILMVGKSLRAGIDNLVRISYGLNSDRNIIFGLAADGRLKVKWQDKTWLTKLIGFQYQPQIGLCLRFGEEFGLDQKTILDSLANFQPSEENFISSYCLNGGTRVIDDGGSSNPVGFQTALELVGQLPAERKILVTAGIVDLGKESTKVHQFLAQLAAIKVNEVWYLGQTGQAEFKQFLKGRVIEDQTAILKRLAKLNADDLLLIEGRMPSWFYGKINF